MDGLLIVWPVTIFQTNEQTFDEKRVYQEAFLEAAFVDIFRDLLRHNRYNEANVESS